MRNAFRPHTVDELYRVLDHARCSPMSGRFSPTGNGPSPGTGVGVLQRRRPADSRSVGYQHATSHDSDVTAAGVEGVDEAR